MRCDTIRALIRTRAIGESATLIAVTPASRSIRAPSMAFLGFIPFGGSISTQMANSWPSVRAS